MTGKTGAVLLQRANRQQSERTQMTAALMRSALAALLLLASPAQAVEELQMSLEVREWFKALSQVSPRRFRNIISENAKIELRDLGIVQTREEFLESLDAWNDATKGAILLTQVVSSQGGIDVVEVCYRFTSNEQLNRETYTYASGRIVAVVQEKIGDACTGF